MKKFTTTIICLLSLIGAYAQAGFTTSLLFVAKLEGEQVVPPIVTTAIGEASFQLNSSRDSLCVNLSARGLTGPITGITINQGPIGGTGSIVVDLSTFIAGNRLAAVIVSPVLNNLFLTTMMNGELYINLTTAANPNGEIRGQLELESDWPFKSALDGSQLNPPVNTSATGLVTFDLSRSMRSLRIRGVFEGLSSAVTGVVLEEEKNGNPPIVVFDLTGNFSNNVLDTEIDPDTFALEINRGNVYIRVSTGNNPNGEIRSRLVKQRPFTFDARMNGSQTVPPLANTAIGTGMISFNSTQDTMWYDFMTSGLTGASTAIELYTGAPGSTGTLVATLGSPNSRVLGFLSGSSIPAGLVNECLLGNVYVNVSTSANPGGEVRGQLLRFAREGFTFNIDGSQESPATSSSAVGTGIASIDRNADNLHFRMIVSGLSGPLVSAHLHNAPAGTPGLVIFDLTPYFTLTGTDDGAFNYWMRPAGFDSSKVHLFLNNQVYVNLHTAIFPNGEVRGQILHEGTCSTVSIGVNELNPLATDYSVYPNPFSGELLNVSFTGLVKGDGQLILKDLSGRTVALKDVNVLKGVNTYEFSGDVTPGMYVLEVVIGNEKQGSIRVVKM